MPTKLPTGYALPSQPPATLYRLLEFLSQRLLLCYDVWPMLSAPLDSLAARFSEPDHHFRSRVTAHLYRLHRVACTGIVNWPHGLFQFLDAWMVGNLPHLQTSAQEKECLEIIWRRWLQPVLRIPDLHFMLPNLVEYLVDHDIPLSLAMVKLFKDAAWFMETTDLWTEDWASRALGLSVRDLHRFSPDSPLGACLWPQSQPKLRLFEGKKTLAVQRQWQRGWSVAEAGEWLGLAQQDIMRLIERGLVTAHKEQNTNGPAQWLLDRDSVEAFFHRVVSRVGLFEGPPYELTCLSETTAVIAGLGIDQVMLLQGISDGILSAYKREPDILSLERICFLDSHVTSLPDLIYARRGWISGRRFASERGVSPSVVVEWVQAGVIQPRVAAGAHRYFDRESLERVAAKLLT